jgi:Uma2 family endonuclease
MVSLSTEQQTQVWTDEAFMALSGEEKRYEVVDGELVEMGNSGMEHGYIACQLVVALGIFLREQKVGAIFDSSTAFTLKSGNRRSPDVSFVAKARLQGMNRPPQGFFQGSPDLAVEILSPGNTVEGMHQKIVEYFENETRLVWVIHPEEKFVLVYHSPEPDQFLRSGDTLEGEDILPGFTLKVEELFATWDF